MSVPHANNAKTLLAQKPLTLYATNANTRSSKLTDLQMKGAVALVNISVLQKLAQSHQHQLAHAQVNRLSNPLMLVAAQLWSAGILVSNVNVENSSWVIMTPTAAQPPTASLHAIPNLLALPVRLRFQAPSSQTGKDVVT